MSTRADCEVILVGTELLKGERVDAHLGYLGRELARCGVRIARAHAVGDVVDGIAECVREAVRRARLVVVTGGLGPTDDDVTREGVARGLGRELEFHEPSWNAITAFFERRGSRASAANRRQAHFPVGSQQIENALGTAPGFFLTVDDGVVFVLPGPPRELKPMFDSAVAPRVKEVFARPPLRIETFRTMGIGESQLMELLGGALPSFKCYDLSSLPSMIGVDLILTAKRDAGDGSTMDREADGFEAMLRETIGHKLYERGERPLAKVVGDLLVDRGETLAVAESLTGGLIGKLITDVPGSSEHFLAGGVTYSDESKTALLGVRAETIAEHGAVSEEVCIEMAHGVRNRIGSTWGLSTTGIAGPAGGSPRKPVGLTYIGVGSEDGSHVKRIVYRGDRDIVRDRAAYGALWILYDRVMMRK